jgi:3-(3-hydroxy-phenyl)propionate hydroxylase
MTSQPFDADVAVVGYGPSGVTAANFLGQYGVSTLVVERAKDIYSRARAVTMDEYTLRMLQQAGLDRALLADMDEQTILRWKTYAGKEFLRITPSDSGYGQPPSPQIFQPAVEKTLRQGVERYTDTVTVNFGVEVTHVEQDAEGVNLRVRDRESGVERVYRTRYLLACDGGSSSVRESLGMDLEGKTKPTTWVIVDAKVKKWWPERDLLTFWSDPVRPVVDIPLSLNHHRWELPLRGFEKKEDFESRESLWNLLKPFGVTEENVEILQHAFYTHHVLMADRWRNRRVFLVGDAAHMMPPWAGQGMQSGIRDAHNIAWKLREVLAGRMSESLLDDYQAEREPHVREMTKLAETLGFFIEEGNPVKIALRNTLLPVLQRLPKIGPIIREFRFKPQPMVKSGLLAQAPSRDSAIGRMIPQPTVSRVGGERLRFDDVLGDGFAVVGIDVDPRAHMSASEQTQWNELGAVFCTVRTPMSGPAADTDLMDYADSIGLWARKYRAQVVILRPDRFVYATDRSGLAIPRHVGNGASVLREAPSTV